MKQASSQRAWLWLLALSVMAGCAPPEQPGDEPLEQRTAALGEDGDHTVDGQEVLNHYAVLAEDLLPGSRSVTLMELAQLPGVKAGDMLFLLQVQGALVDLMPDGAGYGEVLEPGSAGRYELAEVLEVDTAGQALRVRGQGLGGGLRYGYLAAGHTQVIQVPRYRALSITSRGVVTAPAWNGRTGGVVVLSADTVQLSGTISASGLGLRGGRAHNGGGASSDGFRTRDGLLAGERGEGIGGGANEYDTASGRYGRGAAANGGGGGNGYGAPGGGGANGLAPGRVWSGQGVMDASTEELRAAWRLDPAYAPSTGRFEEAAGGGRGGYGCSAQEANPRVSGPGASQWGCGQRAAVGGLGGRPVEGDVRDRLFLGGGGGAGQGDDGDGGGGGNGGGLVFVLARRIQGPGLLAADGAPGGVGGRRGPGGGGGGGTVVLMASEELSGVRVSAAGGTGGTHLAPSNSKQATGGGGGGGGGFVGLVGSRETHVSVEGGKAGTTTQPLFSAMPTNGATQGSPGALSTLPGFGPQLQPPAFAVELSLSLELGAVLEPGDTPVRVYARVSNTGPEPAVNARVVVELPPDVSGSPLPEDERCVASDTGIECTLPFLAVGGSQEFGMALSLSQPQREPQPVRATVMGGGLDTQLANNRAELSLESLRKLRLTGGSCASTGTGGELLGALGLLVRVLLRRTVRQKVKHSGP